MKSILAVYQDSSYQNLLTHTEIENKLELGHIELSRIWDYIKQNAELITQWLDSDPQNKIVLVDMDQDFQTLIALYFEHILQVPTERIVKLSGKENVGDIEELVKAGVIEKDKFTILAKNRLYGDTFTLEDFLEWVFFPEVYRES